VAQKLEEEIAQVKESVQKIENNGERFYSPLVRSIAIEEGLSIEELDSIQGSGKDGRVTKSDLLDYLKNKGTSAPVEAPKAVAPSPAPAPTPKTVSSPPPTVSMSGDKEIIEMDRMRKLIADHMVMSKQTSPHVTSFVEADVTTLVNWRNRIKGDFKKREGQNITFTPIFIEAVAKAIKDFPMINVSVDGTNIVIHKDINIGMAAALPSGNLIVPVVKGADQMNLMGITKTVNDLANRARNNQLKPDEIQGGTFTLTNVGSFGNVMGTPIINQPQVAIMAVGAIKKKPAVIETPHGDLIGIRHMMFLSLSYDHRVVDGALGGSFLRKVADYLEQFDDNTSI
jgi:2-oxoglutarate dehydrogenase E2 component (dihydrolipoamide succinyltransferase)